MINQILNMNSLISPTDFISSKNRTHRSLQATARSAPEREREISSLVRKAEFSADPFAHEFGIAINPAMTEVR